MGTTPKPKPREFLVVVKYAVQQSKPRSALLHQAAQQSSYQMAKPNTVKQVTANTPEAAAELVVVPAGATVHVVPMEHVQTFTRPEKAPLVPAKDVGRA